MIEDKLIEELGPRCRRTWVSFGMPVFEIEREALLDVVQALRSGHGFDLFLDVTAVDFLPRVPRFEVVYHFYSSKHRRRVRLKLTLDEHDAVVPTLTGMYGAARYMEREVHEMYGVRFDGNADLRPILLYEGFVGHPLRKDYPMDLEQPIVPYRK